MCTYTVSQAQDDRKWELDPVNALTAPQPLLICTVSARSASCVLDLKAGRVKTVADISTSLITILTIPCIRICVYFSA